MKLMRVRMKEAASRKASCRLRRHGASGRYARRVQQCTVGLLVAGAVTSVGPAEAQSPPSSCRIVCVPSVTLLTGLIRTHLFGGPTVRKLSTGAESRIPGATSTELLLVTSARTAIPRTSILASVQWLPNATEQRNPFTEYTAAELGGRVRANAPTATFGLSATLVTPAQTQGWVDLAALAADLFSQAARPDDRSAYTHKLDLDLVAHVHVFAKMPSATWLHRVSLYGILDYVATGLPRAGDEVPEGRRFVTGAKPAALLMGFALPLTPSVR
jgi:hypothetical protein